MLRHPLVALLWVVVVSLAAQTAGRSLLDRFGPPMDDEPGPLAAFHRQLVGLALLANGALVLAALGLLHGWLVVALVVALAIPQLLRLCSWRPPTPPRGPAAALLAVAFLFWLSFLGEALLPRLHHDDLVYHLTLPDRYLAAGGLVAFPWSLYANMPHLTELLWSVPMAIGDYTAPKVLAFALAGWTTLALATAVGRRGGPAIAGIAALLFLSGKNVQWHLGPAYVEPVLGAMLLGAALALLAYRRCGGRGWLLIAGLELGFAAASKYTVWPFVAVLAVAFAVATMRRSRGARLAESLVIPALVCLAVAPWMVKNAVVTGNPIYPNLYSSLGGRGWSEVQSMQALKAVHAPGPGPDRTAVDLLRVPFDLTVRDNYHFASFSIALMLLLIVGLARLRSADRDQRLLLVVATAGLALWAVMFTNGRFLVAWVPIAVLAAASPLERWRHRPRLTAGVAVAVLALGGYQLVFQQFPYRPRLDTFSPSRAASAARSATWELSERLEALMPPDGRLLAMWENRFFFLDREVEYDSVYEAPAGLARLRAAGDPGAFAETLAAAGITHVVIHGGQMLRYVGNDYGWDVTDPDVYPRERLEADVELLRRFVAEELELVADVGPHGVFALRRAGSG